MTARVRGLEASVVIVTRNRAAKLGRCLASLVEQRTRPSELLVLDNGSTDATAEVIRAVAASAPFEVRHRIEPRRNLPVLRNLGLEEARHEWVAFIDDDCVADPGWLGALHAKAREQPGCAGVMGRCGTLSPTSPVAMAVRCLEEHWKAGARDGDRILNFEILDTKNILLNRFFIQKRGVRFDETLHFCYGIGEDSDLGMQLEAFPEARLYYCAEALVLHDDLVRRRDYYRKMLPMDLAYLNVVSRRRGHPRSSQVPRRSPPRLRFAIDYLTLGPLGVLARGELLVHLMGGTLVFVVLGGLVKLGLVRLPQ